MIPPPKKPKKIPGEQPDQGHEAVHHVQGEGYQHPKSFKSGNSVPQGVKEVSQLGPKFLILVKNRSNTIPWA